MKRIPYTIVPLLLSASAALAHPSHAPHLHESDALSVVMGLALIAAGAGAAVLLKVRRK